MLNSINIYFTNLKNLFLLWLISKLNIFSSWINAVAFLTVFSGNKSIENHTQSTDTYYFLLIALYPFVINYYDNKNVLLYFYSYPFRNFLAIFLLLKWRILNGMKRPLASWSMARITWVRIQILYLAISGPYASFRGTTSLQSLKCVC